MSRFNKELLAHPSRPPVALACFPTCWDGTFLSLDRVILEYQQVFLGPSSLLGCISLPAPKQIPEDVQSALLKPRVVILLFDMLHPLRILNLITSAKKANKNNNCTEVLPCSGTGYISIYLKFTLLVNGTKKRLITFLFSWLIFPKIHN